MSALPTYIGKAAYLTIALFSLCILLIYLYVINNINLLESFAITYYQCPQIEEPLKHIKTVFAESDITRTPNISDADIILPCGYNNVEKELEDLNVQDAYKQQIIYAIDGCDNLASKNNLWSIFLKKYGFNGACKYLPVTYTIGNIEEINRFKADYRPGTLYFLKKNIQRKEGILLSYDYNQILEESRVGEYKVIQEAVSDLYLIDRRKVNLRVYLLIICDKRSGVSSYLYHEGKCIYSNKRADSKEQPCSSCGQDREHGPRGHATSLGLAAPTREHPQGGCNLACTREQHLTSLNLDVAVYDELPESLEDLREHLGDSKWELLWNRIHDIFRALMSALEEQVGTICHSSKFNNAVRFQLFGADIIFTNKMWPYLLELNKGPSMKYMTENDKKLKLQLTRDIFAMANNSSDLALKRWQPCSPSK